MYTVKFKITLVMAICFLGAFFVLSDSGKAAGNDVWWGHYYNNAYLAGDPAMVRQDPQPRFYWGWNKPHKNVNEDHFSVKWVRGYNVPADGMYEIKVNADDGFRVWVDGRLLMDAWWRTPASPTSTKVWLTKGMHPIQVGYHEQVGNAFFDMTINRVDY